MRSYTHTSEKSASFAEAVPLGPEAYERAERTAIESLPNRVIQAFGAVTFLDYGYPSRVAAECELFRYVDVMHETRFENDFDKLLGGGLTEGEFRLMRDMILLVARLTKEKFGRVAVPRGSLLRAINVLRHIRFLYDDERPRIFEIGPGSGYLGALLMLEGYPYAATDVSQAFYLYQNRLWCQLAGVRLIELTDASTEYPVGELTANQPLHIPWWRLPAFLYHGDDFGVDVITCNHAFNEMHEFGLAFYAALAAKLLRKTQGEPAIVFEGWGGGTRPYPQVLGEFLDRGFGLCMNDAKISVFAPLDSAFGENSVTAPLLARLMPEMTVVPGVDIAENKLCARVREGRRALATQAWIGLDTVLEFYRSVTGSVAYRSDDELFLRAISRTV